MTLTQPEPNPIWRYKYTLDPSEAVRNENRGVRRETRRYDPYDIASDYWSSVYGDYVMVRVKRDWENYLMTVPVQSIDRIVEELRKRQNAAQTYRR